jgi:hypothetical protein
MPGSVQFYDDEGPMVGMSLADGQASVMTDIPAGATRVVVVSQRPPDPPVLPDPEPTQDFELVVTVRVYGGGSVEAAARALAAGSRDLPGDGEVEILTARPA